MRTPATVIARLGGAATRQQLLAERLSGYDLTTAVRRGEIHRIRQARYILASTSADVAAAVRVGGLLAGPSAARTYGLWSGFDTRIHVSVGRNSSRLRTNRPPSFASQGRLLTPDTFDRSIVLHWLKGGATPELGPECWRVSVSSCLRQMVAWTDPETSIACLDTALTVFRLDRGQLAALFVSEPASARLLLSRAREGSGSGVESLVRQRLQALGILVDQQVKFAGIGWVDMRIRGTRVLIEVDGFEFHGDRAAFERDRWRDGELMARGFVVVRLSYEQVTADWAWCERVILSAIGRV